MSLADEVRKFVHERYIGPARRGGQKTVIVRAGDIHTAMGLKGRIPTVCGALGAKKFLEENSLRLAKREGPACAANVYFTYELL